MENAQEQKELPATARNTVMWMASILWIFIKNATDYAKCVKLKDS